MSNKKRVPEIRFEGFEGEWRKCKLGELSDSFEYGLNASAKEFDGKHKYIRITDIDDETRKFDETELTSPDIDISDKDNYRLQKNDILFARTGASVGKSYIYNEDDGILYYAGFLIRARIKLQYNARFIFQSTLTTNYIDFVRLNSQRSGQPGINATEYSEFQLNIPSPEEQSKVAKYLSGIDDVVYSKKIELQKLTQFKQAMLQKMFPKAGEKEPEVRFEGFSGEWEEVKIEECFQESITRSDSGELLSVTLNSGVIKAKDSGRHDTSSDDKSNYKYVSKGDIAYNSMRMWQGASGYSEYDGIVSPAYTVLTPKENIDSNFFAYQFKLDRVLIEFQKMSQGLTSDTWNLKYDKLKNIVVYRTEIGEQKKITNFLKELDNKIELEKQNLEKMKQFKKAMLQKMFV